MPYFDAGSAVLLIEDVLREPELLGQWLMGHAGCRCAIIDSPFSARVERRGLSVDLTIGVGSIVCSPGCGEDAVLAEPAWGQGRLLGGDCVFHGDCGELRAGLAALGFKLKRVGLHEFFEVVGREGVNGVAVLGPDSDALEVEPRGGVCGRLRGRNPLHPAGAVGKPGLEGCVEETFDLVGPRSRLLTPVLQLGGRDIIYSYSGMGDSVVIGYSLASASKYPRLAAWLGALYACSKPAD
ncbi:MAG: hypothetical protein GXO15_01135 [Crenarchaeota archaeon]|nr:hypothetical protein [Thermoproteota archaeon]